MNRYYVEVEGFYVIAEDLNKALDKAKEEVDFFPPRRAVVASVILWDEEYEVKL